MKRNLLSVVATIIVAALSYFPKQLSAQTNYSFSVSSILNAGATGIRIPNGTIVTAEKVSTTGCSHSTASGTTNPDGMGGTFTGTSFLPAYIGSRDRNSFTIIESATTRSIDNGVSNDAVKSIGFRIHFDRPTTKISFLSLDTDGFNTDPGNADGSQDLDSMELLTFLIPKLSMAPLIRKLRHL